MPPAASLRSILVITAGVLVVAALSHCGRGDGADASTTGGGAAESSAATAGGSTPLMSDPFDPQARAEELATARCAFYARCEPSRLGSKGISESDCVAEQTLRVGSLHSVFAAAIAAGRTVFHEAAFDECIAQLAAEDCMLGVPESVCHYVEGAAAVGAPCHLDDECRSDLGCSGYTNGCGTCRARVADFENCAEAACEQDAVCVWFVDIQFCWPTNLDEGAPCQDYEGQSGCRGHLNCVDATCQRPGLEGAVCDWNTLHCDTRQNTTCLNGICETLTWSAPGESCGSIAECNIDGVCEGPSWQCAALPGPGESCANTKCASGSFCNGSTCKKMPGEGANCGYPADCQVPFICNGKCVEWTWPLCQ